MKVLYELIHKRATEAMKEPPSADNYDQYARLWIGAASNLEAEFRMGGLIETANYLNVKIIEFHKKHG